MVAVSAVISTKFPTTPLLLLRIAQAAGSRIELARSARALEKNAKHAEQATVSWKTHRAFCTQSERNEAAKKYQPLYANEADFLGFLQRPARGTVGCPGFRK